MDFIRFGGQLVSHDIYTHALILQVLHTRSAKQHIHTAHNEIEEKNPILLLLLYAKKENSNHLTVVISIWLQTHSVNEQRQLISTHTKKKFSLSRARSRLHTMQSTRKQVPHTQIHTVTNETMGKKTYQTRIHRNARYTQSLSLEKCYANQHRRIYLTHTHIHWLVCMCALQSSNRHRMKKKQQ